jgi:hypothetical protein
MTTFKSTITLPLPVERVYAFLEDCNNHEQLQPENIYNWSSTRDEANFTIKNMAKLSLKVVERVENASIRFEPGSEAPFEVSLTWLLRPIDAGTEVSIQLDAELNMMMKMVASGPLQKLIDHQINKLPEVL